MVTSVAKVTNPNIAPAGMDAYDGTKLNQLIDDINTIVGVSKNGAAITGTRNKLNLIEGANITITVADNSGQGRVDVTIAATGGGGGEANTASNVGTAGVGIFKQKVAVNLEFKKVNAASNRIAITDDTGNSEVDVDVNEGNLILSNLGGTLPITKGGTGQTAANAAFNALSPMTTNGDLITRLAGIAARLGPGANGDVLQIISGLPAWGPNTGGGSATDPSYDYLIYKSGSTYIAIKGSDGSTLSSNTSFNTVWNAVTADAGTAGKKLILMGPGQFITDAAGGISISRGNFHLRGCGMGVTEIVGHVDLAVSGNGSRIFSIVPSNTSAGVSLTANAVAGQSYVDVASTSGFADGDYVSIRDNVVVDSEIGGRNNGEIHRVFNSPTSTRIFLEGTLADGYTTGQSAKIAKLDTFYENITISDLTFTTNQSPQRIDGTSVSDTGLLSEGQTVFRYIRNLSFNKVQWKKLFYAGVVPYQCLDVKFSTCDFHRMQGAHRTPVTRNYNNTDTTGTAISLNGTNTKIGQEDTATPSGSTNTLIKIKARLKKTGAPTGVLVARMYDGSGNHLATSFTVDVSNLTTSYADYYFYFSTEANLYIPGSTTVRLMIEGGPGFALNGGTVDLGVSASSTYASGGNIVYTTSFQAAGTTDSYMSVVYAVGDPINYGAQLRAGRNWTVQNCTGEGNRHTITQDAGATTPDNGNLQGKLRNLVIDGNTFTFTSVGHIDLHEGCDGAIISSNELSGDDGGANAIQFRSPAIVTSNRIKGQKGKGIYAFNAAGGGATKPDLSIIAHNWIENCPKGGIVIESNVNDVSVYDNDVIDCSDSANEAPIQGKSAGGMGRSMIIGNRVFYRSITAGAAAMIHVNADNTTVAFNVCINDSIVNQSVTIRFNTACDNCLAESNRILSNGTGTGRVQVDDETKGNIVRHNSPYESLAVTVTNPFPTTGNGNIGNASQAAARPATTTIQTVVTSDKLITVTGGTVTAIIINGITVKSASEFSQVLKVGETFRMDYTGTPTVVVKIA